MSAKPAPAAAMPTADAVRSAPLRRASATPKRSARADWAATRLACGGRRCDIARCDIAAVHSPRAGHHQGSS